MQIKKTFSSHTYTASYLADEVHEGMRLDTFAVKFYPTLSREKIKKKIKEKELTITNRTTANKPSSKIQEGDTIQIIIRKTVHEDEYWNGKLVRLQEHPEIIYEDENIIAISKPAFMATHPTGKHLFYCATVYFESRDNKTIHSVHRLDRETSGLLLLAKNPKIAGELTYAFEHSQIKKCYFFIAHNCDLENKINFSSSLRLGSTGDDLRSRVVTQAFPEDSKQGKSAITHFKILFKTEKYVLGLAFPQTGRQHQIRVHAKNSGYPLLGDKLYHGGYKMFQHFKDGVATNDEFNKMQIPRHALHAIGINTPYKKKPTIISTIPIDLEEWIGKNIIIDLLNLKKEIVSEITTYFSQV